MGHEAQRAAGASSPQWVLVGISGELRDDSGTMPYMPYAGLGEVLATAQQEFAWKLTQGGSVRWSPQTSVHAPQAREAVQARDAPWVLFRSVPSEGHGLLNQITYVQLLATSGGAPPAGAIPLGRRVQVPNTARYAFYIADRNTPAASSTPAP